MAMELHSGVSQNDQSPHQVGTLAIDLGNTTTVVAFQGEQDTSPRLLHLPPISRVQGEVPSILWCQNAKDPNLLVGQQVLLSGLASKDDPGIYKDFKRWIGEPCPPNFVSSNLLPEKAGELLLQQIWQRLPPQLKIKRLVLTAPVESYRTYRSWLSDVCDSLPVEEVALVDEPTAAAMGASLPSGSKLLVVDIGGSTIDLSLVALEGGEGRAEPIAQLLRFGGQNLENRSRQVLRCAKVLGKAGIRLGGQDLDRWIAAHLFPNAPLKETLLNAAEKLKCRLSKKGLKGTEVLLEIAVEDGKYGNKQLRLSRNELEGLLIKNGLLKSLDALLKQTLASGRANNCTLQDLRGVVVVGGGARIPLIREWLREKTHPAPLLTPPPIEAVAIGAIRLTPGVTVQDVLHRGVSLRCWDKRSDQHIWHPLFLAGQPWPTSAGLEIVLASSQSNQRELELVLGEPVLHGTHEVIYIDGVPTVQSKTTQTRHNSWSAPPSSISLNPPGQAGEDCLRLKFNIDSDSNLKVEGIDLRSGEALIKRMLGRVR